MVKIRYVPLPDNKVKYKKSSYYMAPEWIVIHNTANNAPAINEVNYMGTSDDWRSFHFAVDDKEAVQGLPLDANGWHAGDGEYGVGNRQGIGIEICYSLSDEYRDKFKKAQENAAELAAYLLNKFGWGMDESRITKHQDYDSKHCPHRTLDDYGWDYFIELVKGKYSEFYENDDSEEDEEVTQEQFNEMMKNYLSNNTLAGYATEKQLAKAIDGIQTVDEYMDQELGNKPSSYAKEAAAWAIDAGIFRGDGDGNYNWTLPIKREDVASVLYRDRYQTVADISDKESREVISRLVEKNIIKGRGGDGDETRIDLPKDIVRVLVYLDRAGVFE